ncbi:MAG: type II secretion system F family protein [Candidatus Omnitrophica bacterium]|nr:type II secretion system F family protein [Candidatus Omnitrophota bacterium]
MITYEYIAKKNNGETVHGKINAQSQDEAIDLVNQLGFIPVSVSAGLENKKKAVSVKNKYGKVTAKELSTFSRQLANLLKSGVSIVKALDILSEQTQNQYLRNVVSDLLWNVKNGKALSESLGKFPNLFSPLYLTLIRAGEEGGDLQQMLYNVADYQKRQEEILRKVKMAMAYPILMAVLGFMTVYFVLTFILPKMQSLFENIGNELPLATKVLLFVSNALSHYWYIFFIIAGLLIFFFRRAYRSEKGRAFLSRFILNVPMFGGIILRTELSRFARTLVLLHRGGVSFLRALEISIPILSNDVIKQDLELCKNNLMSGGTFGEGIKESKQIPAIMGHMIAVGEESGNLDEVLEEIADTYEQETNDQINVMTTLLEPILILTVGLIIGFIVFAMLLPVFQIDVLSH